MRARSGSARSVHRALSSADGAAGAATALPPSPTLQLRETVTDNLLRELIAGDLDLIVVALPIEHEEIETHHLFDDRFILAAQANAANEGVAHATPGMLANARLLLLEEGHCLGEQALSYCHLMTREARESFGASSLATIVQMVANGYGVTLLPEMALASEVHHRSDIRLLRFAVPEPKREIGFARRRPVRARRTFCNSRSFCAMPRHNRKIRRNQPREHCPKALSCG